MAGKIKVKIEFQKEKIKFMVGRKLGIISDQKDILISRLTSMSYVEAKNFFQSFEIANATTLHRNSKDQNHYFLRPP